ncbi:MAG TPA: DUF4331 domain-containing protein [Gaiellaceae bacterium]|nr:DUF4331 domain-containing protein [Gaiellaceae bacterium]
MRKLALVFLVAAGATLLALFVGRLAPSSSSASSHREAPLISEDPTADNTDLYAFRSPDKPNTLTIVSNWIPGEDPAAGPNYYTFSQTAKYNIFVDRNGDGRPDLTYSFRFKTPTGPYFLGNTVQNWTATLNGKPWASGKTPMDNIGPRQQALAKVRNYETSAEATIVHENGVAIFAGQRDDPFFADVGAIFDLVAIRKPGTTGNKGGGRDFLSGYNVHTIALQIPISQVDTPSHTIGVWSSTDRQDVVVNGVVHKGWTQVSRLGEPLVNEVVIPTGLKDLWNRTSPANDAQFEKYYETPILAAVLNKLYKVGAPTTNRSDLVAVLGTGIPKVTYTGKTFADELRINLAIPPAAHPNRMGVLAGDNAGFPNGRRLGDDVVDIEEQAVAGFLMGHKVPLGDGVNGNDVPYLTHFPYVAPPHQGYANSKATTA